MIINLKSVALAMTSICLFAQCTPTPTSEASYDVIPMPQSITLTESSEPFVLHSGTQISYTAGNADMERNAQFLKDYLAPQLGYELKTVPGIASKGIVLQLVDGEATEGYKITVDANRVLVEATSPAGIFYGIQTIRKSLPVEQGAVVALPAGTITDAPRFDYRGAHLDVCRHFYPVDSIKTYIDMLALHNMNKFHWHLTEDQGWRIEIKQFPKLTEIGSVRNGTMIRKDWDSNDSIQYGGFYTQDECREIIKYAADRYITVMPEIDMPGHMVAAVTAYPELGCTGGPYSVRTIWGVSEELLCAGNDKVYDFVEKVLDEVMEIFPSKDIHIGGDECPKTEWEKCPKCQKKIKELGLKKDKQFTAEQKLQAYFTQHVDEYLTKHGRNAIGWDEILEGGVSENATVMSWRGEVGGIEAARLKHRVIMTPNTYCYFDYYQSKDRDNEPFAIGGFLPASHVYSYEPLPASLTPEEQSYIWGVQCNVWTEYIPTFSQVQYMILPRGAALAEVQWSQPEVKNYEKFKNERLPRLIKIYELNNYNYCKRIYTDKEEPSDLNVGW